MKKALAILFLTVVSSSALAGDLECKVTQVLATISGIKLGDTVTFSADRTQVSGAHGYRDRCEKAPAGVAEQAGAALVLGCGEGNDRDIYVFKKDGKTVELWGLAIFTCH